MPDFDSAIRDSVLNATRATVLTAVMLGLAADPAAAGTLSCTRAGRTVLQQTFPGAVPDSAQSEAEQLFPDAACITISDAPKILELPSTGEAPADLDAALKALTGHVMPPALPKRVDPAASRPETPEPPTEAFSEPTIIEPPKMTAPWPNWVKLATYRNVTQTDVLAHWTALAGKASFLARLTPALKRAPYGWSSLSAGPVPPAELMDACLILQEIGADCEPALLVEDRAVETAIVALQASYPGYVLSEPYPQVSPYRLILPQPAAYTSSRATCWRSPLLAAEPAPDLLSAKAPPPQMGAAPPQTATPKKTRRKPVRRAVAPGAARSAPVPPPG